MLPVFRKRKAVIARVGERHARSGNHAALAHGEAGDDGEGEDGEDDFVRQDLDQVGGEGLAKVAVECLGDVDDGIGYDELEEPAEGAADGAGEEDGARAGDVGVAAFFCQVEGAVVTGHGPDYAWYSVSLARLRLGMMEPTDEGHQNANTGWEISALIYVAPDFSVGRELRQPIRCPIAGRRDDDNDHDKRNDIERATGTIDASNPPRRERGHATMNDHDQNRQQERLVVRRDVAWILDATTCENHGRRPVVDRWCSSDLSEPVRPSGYPGGQRTPAGRCKDCRSVVETTRRRHRRAELCH